MLIKFPEISHFPKDIAASPKVPTKQASSLPAKDGLNAPIREDSRRSDASQEADRQYRHTEPKPSDELDPIKVDRNSLGNQSLAAEDDIANLEEHAILNRRRDEAAQRAQADDEIEVATSGGNLEDADAELSNDITKVARGGKIEATRKLIAAQSEVEDELLEKAEAKQTAENKKKETEARNKADAEKIKRAAEEKQKAEAAHTKEIAVKQVARHAESAKNESHKNLVVLNNTKLAMFKLITEKFAKDQKKLLEDEHASRLGVSHRPTSLRVPVDAHISRSTHVAAQDLEIWKIVVANFAEDQKKLTAQTLSRRAEAHLVGAGRKTRQGQDLIANAYGYGFLSDSVLKSTLMQPRVGSAH
jgi:hypothetical protein